MNSSKSSHLLEVLRATLHNIENSTDWSQDDHAVVELKRILNHRIDQELANSQDSEPA